MMWCTFVFHAQTDSHSETPTTRDSIIQFWQIPDLRDVHRQSSLLFTTSRAYQAPEASGGLEISYPRSAKYFLVFNKANPPDYFMEDFFLTFNVFMTVDRLCTLLMSYYNETVKTDDRYLGDEGGFDLKATEQKKIRLVSHVCCVTIWVVADRSVKSAISAGIVCRYLYLSK